MPRRRKGEPRKEDFIIDRSSSEERDEDIFKLTKSLGNTSLEASEGETEKSQSSRRVSTRTRSASSSYDVSFASTPQKRRKRKMAAAKNRRRKLAVEKPATRKRGRPVASAGGERAKKVLRAAGEALPGRQIEFEEIRSKLAGALKTAQGICLYISGVPGTGKTATVLECVAALQKSRSAKFDFVEINGMKLSDPGQVYAVLWRAVSGKQASPKAALAHLQAYFKEGPPRPTVVLLDELDTLLRKRHSILYHFFEWTGWKHAQLIIVTISNTMDLPERYLANRIASRMGLNRVNFQPYSYKQLQDVIRYRMPEQSSWFTVDAIEIIGRKVSSVSGDARRALAAARRAVDFVMAQWKAEGRADQPGPGSITFQVMTQVIDGGSAGSPYTSIKALSALQMALLEVIVLAGKHQQRLSDTFFDAICTRFWQHCRTQAVPEPSLCAVLQALMRLAQAGLVRVDSTGFLHTESRVVSLVTEDDIAAVKPAKS